MQAVGIFTPDGSPVPSHQHAAWHVPSTQAMVQFKQAQCCISLKTKSQGKPTFAWTRIRDRAAARHTTSECSKYWDFPPIPMSMCHQVPGADDTGHHGQENAPGSRRPSLEAPVRAGSRCPRGHVLVTVKRARRSHGGVDTDASSEASAHLSTSKWGAPSCCLPPNLCAQRRLRRGRCGGEPGPGRGDVGPCRDRSHVWRPSFRQACGSCSVGWKWAQD